jgi:hypothetical protein
MNTKDKWLELLSSVGVTQEENFTSPPSFFQESLENHQKNNIEKIHQEYSIKDLIKDDNYLLSHERSPVFAYIRRFKKGDTKAVHFTYCNKIKELPKAKLYCTNDSSGKFEVDLEDKKGNITKIERMELKPCEFCIGLYYGLSNYAYKDERKKIKDSFDYKKVYSELGKTLQQDAWVSQLYEFTDKSWTEISREKRKESNWTCEKCHLELTEKHSKYLHAHHRNHNRNFNHDINLEC